MERKYRYKAFAHRSWFIGYISGKNKLDAINTVRGSFDRVVYVQRCWIPEIVSQAKVIHWFATLSLLMRGGIKIEEALQILSGYKGYEFTISLLQLIKSGRPFQDALFSCSFFFDRQTLMMSKALLRYLSIEDTCEFIVRYKTKIYEKYQETKSSLVQPCISLLITISVCLGLLFFLVPTIESVFLDMNMELPPSIQLLRNMSTEQAFLVVLAIVGIVYLIIKRFRSFPFIRDILTDRDIFVTFYFIGQGLKNGLKIIEAIDVSIPVLRTCYVKNLMRQLREDIMQGSTVFNSLKSMRVDDVYVNIVRVNELTGTLAQGFIAASDAANQRFQNQLGLVSRLAAPALTVVTGLLILGFLNTFIFPMYACISSALN